jgi:hypothetical protein
MGQRQTEAELVELGGHERMTVQEALGLVAREAPTSVLIVFEDAEGNFILRSSRMERKDSLWLIEKARDHILGREV